MSTTAMTFRRPRTPGRPSQRNWESRAVLRYDHCTPAIACTLHSPLCVTPPVARLTCGSSGATAPFGSLEAARE
eukprot:2394792-Prymnesium_polylepis.1